MKPKLIIYGAGDNGGKFACEYRDLNRHREYELVGFVDDTKRGKFLGFPILGTGEDLRQLKETGIEHILVFLFRDPIRRLEKCLEIEKLGFDFPSFHPYVPRETHIGKGVCIHDSAVLLGYDVYIDDFSAIGPQVTVEGRVKIGKGTILSPHVFIGHECEIGEATVFYPRATCHPKTKVGSRCKIWPHALVHKNVEDDTEVNRRR